MKLAHPLGLAGYVETVRGKGGGLRLAREPKDIVRGEVVRHAEPDRVWVPSCDPVGASCAILPCCRLIHALAGARRAFLTALDQHTLADLVRPRARLRRLLAIEAGAGPPPRPAGGRAGRGGGRRGAGRGRTGGG